MVYRRSRAILLSLLLGSFATACNCEQKRLATYSGHLGDSVLAVGIPTTASGGMDFHLGEFDGKMADSKSMGADVNLSGFMDSVAFIRLIDFRNVARTPIHSQARTQLFSISGSVLKISERIPDDKFQTLWDIFASGNGMIELVPYQGSAVRARLKPVSVGGWKDYCT